MFYDRTMRRRVLRTKSLCSKDYQIWIVLMAFIVTVQILQFTWMDGKRDRGDYVLANPKVTSSLRFDSNLDSESLETTNTPNSKQAHKVYSTLKQHYVPAGKAITASTVRTNASAYLHAGSSNTSLKQSDETGACTFITSTNGGLFPAETQTDMNDWTFRETQSCEPFNTQLESKVRDKVTIDCSASPPKLMTTTTARSDDVFTVDFGDECLGNYIDNCCMDDKPVPNVIHLIWYTEQELGYFNFLSLISIIRFVKPCLILLHGPFVPFGEYWDFAVQTFPNIVHVVRDRPKEVFEHQLAFREHSSDVMRIQALIRYGGIYMDFDEVLLRPIDTLRRFEYTQGHELAKTMGSQVVLSKKNATFLHLWYQSYRDDYRKIWAYNALWVPNTLAKHHPDLIHVEGFNFTRPNWKNVKQIFESNYDWRTNYGMHMYARWYKQPVDLDIMRTLNSTVGAVSRHIVLGNKELCYK